MQVRLRTIAIACGVMVAAVSCGGGGGGGTPPTNPSPGGGGGGQGSNIVTITINADGTVTPKDATVEVGGVVRFVNNDTRTHEVMSNPHLVHTDCPQLNSVGSVSAGATKQSGAFSTIKVCGFHDHMNPDSTAFHGIIRVAGAEGPGGPVYIKP